jgi:tRNA (guanine-N7-)-methyltransferase
MSDGPIEYEHGVPIPGQIRPQSEWAKTALKRLPEAGPLDWPAIFGRTAPLVLDLGCGNGRFTLMSALARPDFDHVAVDLLPVVIRYATRRANQRGLHNVRFAVKDAQTFMRQYVAPSSIAEIHVDHPQLYHDPRKAAVSRQRSNCAAISVTCSARFLEPVPASATIVPVRAAVLPL